MTDSKKQEWFSEIESVIDDSMKFKAKLGIGEDTYKCLRLKNKLEDVWGPLATASTGVLVAKSSVVASTFFAPSGLLGLLGIGTAVTPVGWVIAAAVVTGGTWIGVSRYFKKMEDQCVTVIPKFINTPLDVLALGLFDLIAPLALKVAKSDGHIDESEKKLIINNFVKEWGYNNQFVLKGIEYVEQKLDDFKLDEVAAEFCVFAKVNKDCKYGFMEEDLLVFLRDIVEANETRDPREEMVIENIQSHFNEANNSHWKNITNATTRQLNTT
jgi:hypothetical protein